MFTGFTGLLTLGIVPLSVWGLAYSQRKFPSYNLDPKGKEGAFEPLLQKYLHLAEFTITLATGSIVLLVGSSVLHGADGHLPWFYASPLLILAGSVLFGVAFMAFLTLEYENVQHGNPHTAKGYALVETLGFTSLLLFVIGYFWLIVVVTR